MIKTLLSLLILLGFVYVAAESFVVYRHIRASRSLVSSSKIYEQKNASGQPRILVVGDSTAVGTGVTDPRFSIAGRFGNDYPGADITNLSKNGAKMHDVVMTLRTLPTESSYDLIVIQVGANDVISFSNVDELPIEGMLELAKKLSPNIIWLTAGNIGLAPIFPWPVNAIMTARTRALRSHALLISAKAKVIYADLFKERGSDPFERDIPRYYASDRLHLSNEGYGYWYTQIREALATTRIVLH